MCVFQLNSGSGISGWRVTQHGAHSKQKIRLSGISARPPLATSGAPHRCHGVRNRILGFRVREACCRGRQDANNAVPSWGDEYPCRERWPVAFGGDGPGRPCWAKRRTVADQERCERALRARTLGGAIVPILSEMSAKFGIQSSGLPPRPMDPTVASARTRRPCSTLLKPSSACSTSGT